MKKSRVFCFNKTFNYLFLLVILSLLGVACGGGSSEPGFPPRPLTTATISGSVSGTVIVAVDDSGNILATDNTAGKTADLSGNYPFTLTDIPVGTNVRVYLMTASGVYPLYFATPSTNVFLLSTVATIDLGFVDTTGGSGQAIPANDPTAVAGVSAGTKNTATPTVPAGGTFIVHVVDDNSGLPLPGATVIVDHASDPRQLGTTATDGSASFTIPNGGPLTVTVGKSDYELGTLVETNISFLNMSIHPMGLSAFVEGTAITNYTGQGLVLSVGVGDLDDSCSGCENLYNGTVGFYRLKTLHPNNIFNVSAFDYAGGTVPVNFTSIVGVGPLVDGQTYTWDPVFPVTPPVTTTTTGTITVPTNLGTISEVATIGWSDVGNQGVMLGVSPIGSVQNYFYTLTTFDYAVGFSNDVMARAEGTTGTPRNWTASVKRGVGFGGSAVDFILIDVPINLSPSGSCGSVVPTLSWGAVSGASFYVVKLKGASSDWEVLIDGGSSSFTLPDLTGTTLAALGLLSGVSVNWNVQAVVVPGFDLNTINLDTAQRTFSDSSGSSNVTCTLP